MKSDNINHTTFEESKLTQIVSFDSKFYLKDFDELKKEDLKKLLLKTSYFKESSPDFKPFSKIIYDSEYADDNSNKIIVITSQLNISNIISVSKEFLESDEFFKNELSKLDKESQNAVKKGFESSKLIIQQFCKEMVKVIVSFDSCGIHSVRFDFDLKSIKTRELIEMIESTCFLIDNLFFPILKKDFEGLKIIKKDCLSEHMVYSIISSTKAFINPIYVNREILGISWKQRDYALVTNNILKELTKNDIAIFKGDILTITTQAVLMVFPDLKANLYNNYVEERINAIEIFWRQKLLLKKMHFELNKLIKNVNENNEKVALKSEIKKILKMQITIQSELEVYRNTIISITHSYSMLFDTLNEVFKTDNEYKFIQEKLETCKSLYDGLNDEKRNQFMENIQVIVIFIGLATISLTFLTDVVYGFSFNKAINIIIITFIMFILFASILKYRNNLISKFRTF